MADPTALFIPTEGKLQSDIDREIAELAGRQHGQVARWQLLGLGLTGPAIDSRIRRGLLHPVDRGVYAVGHRALPPLARPMAAVLAIGGDAAVSHRDASVLWHVFTGFSRRMAVTVPRSVRSRRRIEVHCAHLPPDEVTVVDGIPVTTVPRTILDLAAVADRRLVERAIHEAEVRRLWDPLSVADLVDRYPRRPGTPMLRAVLAELRAGLGLTRSELEAAFLVFVEEQGLPRPEVNAAVRLGEGWIEVDFLWRDRRVIVEVDGAATHHTARRFEGDRERDRRLQVSGWRVVRVTWRQLERHRAEVAADLRSLLG